MSGLKKLRERIDETDEIILGALAQRMGTVEDILSLKEMEGLPIFDAPRETEILAEIGQRAAARGLDPDLARRVLREVISHSRETQARQLQARADPLRASVKCVAYQGVAGAYSWVTARNYFGETVELIGCATFREVFEAVQGGVAQRALLPIENTLAGSVHEVYDLLAETRLHVVGEEILKIEHCLIGLESIPLEQIRLVLSHPMALQQCSRLLRRLPGARIRAYVDTAEAVAKVCRDGDVTRVAIASRQAAERFSLSILQENIADHIENYTRFWIISSSPIQVESHVPARTSLLLITDHREGALVHSLQSLAAHGINMTKLESRPIRETPWQYSFYLDVEGNLNEERVTQALDGMRERARVLRILGCYPRTQRVGGKPPGDSDSAANQNKSQRPAISGPTAALSPPSENSAPAVIDSSAPLYSRARRRGDTVVTVGGVSIGGIHEFVVMAGPCAVESREQIMAAAAIVKQAGGHILRGGAYKPRTSPYSFQGLGDEGIALLVEAGRTHGLPVVSEVLSPELAPSMSEHVDLLQVGARNMQNYQLLRELGRCNRPILLKRGMSATIEELLNAAEYILAGGNQQVILCERGIRTFDTAMRATLDLGAVVVLKEKTHLPVIVDPSHAAGKREWVPPLVRAARAVGCDGIIVEVHPEPDRAKSDAAQTLNPEQFEEMMDSIT